MNRAAKKALALAVGGLWITNFGQSKAHAQIADVWQTTTGSQDWFTSANWNNGVPTSTSEALFSTFIPPSKDVTFGSVNTSVGAIIDDLADNSSPSNLEIDGTGTLTLTGINYTANYAGGLTYAESNVILGAASASTALTAIKTLTFGGGLTMALAGSQNTILSAPYVNANKNTTTGQQLYINGNLVDGTGVHSALYIGGGGTLANDGGVVFLAGSGSTYSGGTVIGQANETDSAVLEVNADAVTTNSDGSLNSVVTTATGTGNVLINDGSQLLLNGTATNGQTLYFMNSNQTLTINGIGVGNNSSGAIRTNGNATTQTFDVLANVVLGTVSTTDLTKDDGIVMSPTSVPTRTILFSGQVTSLPGYAGINKQGAGNLEFSNTNNNFGGFMQIGNGDVTVDPGSSIGSGDLILFQTSSNTAYINFENASETIGSLSSAYTTQGTFPQNVHLYGTAGFFQGTAAAMTAASGSGTTLMLNQNENTVFGFVSTAGWTGDTSTIDGPGNVQINSGSKGVLSLTGPNAYTGSTTINGGTLNAANGTNGSVTGTVGDVTINSGGTLTTGDNITVLGTLSKSGTVGGSHDGGTFTNLIVNSGGVIQPGGNNLVGTLNVGGNLDLNSGSITDIDLIGGTNALADQINVTNALDASSGAVLNVLGSKLAFGNYTLFNIGSLTGSLPTITSAPNTANRQYNLDQVGNSLVLEILDTGTDRFWSVGGTNPPADGSGTWSSGSTNFFVQTGTTGLTQVAYSNASTADLIFGNSGGGGNVTLGSGVVVGGALVFSPVSGAYTLSGANTLQLNGGIVSSNNSTISSPVVLGASQTFTTSAGTTLTINGGISETGGSQTLTTGDLGTIVLGGISTYSGGTIITQGTVEATTASALPTAGGVQISSGANLALAFSTSGSYGGAISGSGGVTINNTSSAVAARLSSAGNTYSGPTTLLNGLLQVDNTNELGGGNSSLVLSGGTLQATADGLDFPATGPGAGAPINTISLVSGTTSAIDTNGHDVTMNQNINGIGTLNKIGAGDLTLTGLVTTTTIGTVGIGAGTLTFDPLSPTPSFGFSATTLATANTFTGNLTIAAAMDLRLQGGYITGGGTINIIPSNTAFDSHGQMFIGNTININPTNLANYDVQIYAASGDEMTISGPIQGTGSVEFSGGSGQVLLTGTSTYVGSTLVDTGPSKVEVAVNNALPVTTDVTISSAGSGSVLDIDGVSQSINSLSNTGTQAIVENDAPLDQDGNPQPATLIIDGNGTTTFSGVLQDGQNSPLGLTLGAGNTGSLTLSGGDHIVVAGIDEGATGISGPINIIAGRLDITNPAALGDPSVITVGATVGDSQLHFNGVTSALVFTSSANPSGGPIPPIVLDGMGGYMPLAIGSTFEPGAIDVVGSGNVTLANQITLAATSSMNVGTNSTLTITNTITGTGGLVITANNGGGIFNLQASNTYSGGTTLNGATTTAAVANALPLNGNVVNNSLLIVQANQTIGNLNGTGTLSLTNSSTVKLAAGTGASTAGAVNIGSGSTLDLTNNTLVINFGSPAADPISSIAAAIKSGASFNGSESTWTGTGIVSSTAASSNGRYSIGYLDGNVSTDNTSNNPIGQNEIIVKYTLTGDAFLENTVGFDDLLTVAQNYGSASGRDWAQGSFDYTGSVGFGDLLSVAQAYGSNSGISQGTLGGNTGVLSLAWQSASAQIGGAQVGGVQVSAVPEPGSLAIVAAGAGALLARRRRRMA